MKPQKPSEILRRSATRTFLVTNPVNVRYLTGLNMSFGMAFITQRTRTLYTDPRYLESAESSCAAGWKVKHYDRLQRDVKTYDECGFESRHVTVSHLESLKKKCKGVRFKPCKEVVEHFRRSKDDDELKAFKRSQKITRSIMKRIPQVLIPGVTEADIAWRIREWAHDAGADDLSFDPIVAFGSNSSRPHHQPGIATLKKRDIVQIDCGVKYKGYCSDQSRVFFVGEPTAKMREVHAAVSEAKDAVEKSIKVGATNHELDRVARESLRSHELEQFFTHALGHGVGLDIHEGVSLSSKAKKTALMKHEIVTVEPGVYIPGTFGIRIEDEIVIE